MRGGRLFCALVLAVLAALAVTHARAAPPVALGVLTIDDAAERDAGIFLLRGRLEPPAPPADALPDDVRPLGARVARLDADLAAALGEMARHDAHTRGPTLQALIDADDAARLALLHALERHGAGLGADAWLLRGRLERDVASAAYLEATDAALSADREPPPRDLSTARSSLARAASLGGLTTPGLWARLLDAEAALDVAGSAADPAVRQRLAADAGAGLAIVAANAPPSALRAQALLDLADVHEGEAVAASYLLRAREGANDAQRRYLDLVTLSGARRDDPARALAAGLALTHGDRDDPAVLATLGDLLLALDDSEGTRLPADVPPERAAAVLVAAGRTALEHGDPQWAERALRSAAMRASGGAAARDAAAMLATIAAAPIVVEAPRAWLLRVARICARHTELPRDEGLAPLDVLVRLGHAHHQLHVAARADPRTSDGATRLAACIAAPGHDEPAMSDGSVVTATLHFTEGWPHRP